jgi:glycosyltransferase involved in cell wall biosynthesis
LKCAFIISYHIIPYAFFAAFASFFSKIPYFVCQTGSLIQNQSQNNVLWFFLEKIINRSQKICVPGNQSYDFWVSKGIHSNKVVKLHSTVDTHKFECCVNYRKQYDFIFVGRIAEEKRLDFLITAFNHLLKITGKKTNLLIVGVGPLLSQTRALVRSLNLETRTTFTGFQEDVLPWLKRSRFLLLTSRTEGLPCAVMEGMSAGLIPITTNVGNLSDIVIDGKTGFCVEKDNVYGFAEKMADLLGMENDKLRQMQINSRNIIVDHHSYKSACVSWKKLILSGS